MSRRSGYTPEETAVLAQALGEWAKNGMANSIATMKQEVIDCRYVGEDVAAYAEERLERYLRLWSTTAVRPDDRALAQRELDDLLRRR